MITQTGEVLEWHDGVARVRVPRFSGCGQCHMRHGCGAGTLARALPGRSLEFSLAAATPLRRGDQVTIGLRESSLLAAAALVYLIPLLMLVGGAVLLAPFGDAASAAGGIGGLLGGILVARGGAGRAGRGSRCEPVLLDGNASRP